MLFKYFDILCIQHLLKKLKDTLHRIMINVNTPSYQPFTFNAFFLCASDSFDFCFIKFSFSLFFFLGLLSFIFGSTIFTAPHCSLAAIFLLSSHLRLSHFVILFHRLLQPPLFSPFHPITPSLALFSTLSIHFSFSFLHSAIIHISIHSMCDPCKRMCACREVIRRGKAKRQRTWNDFSISTTLLQQEDDDAYCTYSASLLLFSLLLPYISIIKHPSLSLALFFCVCFSLLYFSVHILLNLSISQWFVKSIFYIFLFLSSSLCSWFTTSLLNCRRRKEFLNGLQLIKQRLMWFSFSLYISYLLEGHLVTY